MIQQHCIWAIYTILNQIKLCICGQSNICSTIVNYIVGFVINNVRAFIIQATVFSFIL